MPTPFSSGIPPSLAARNADYTLARLYSAARHLKAGQPAHQFVDRQGQVHSLVDKWASLSPLAIFHLYRDAQSEINNRWLFSVADRPETTDSHMLMNIYCAFVSQQTPSALAWVLYRRYAMYSEISTPAPRSTFHRIPEGLTRQDYCIVMIYWALPAVEYRAFRLSNGHMLSWAHITGGFLYDIYMAAARNICQRWSDGELYVETHGDLMRAARDALVAKMFEIMNRYCTVDGGIGMASSPHQEVLQVSEHSSTAPRGGSPSYVPDNFDIAHDMSL